MNRSRWVETFAAAGFYYGFAIGVGTKGGPLLILAALGFLYGLFRWRYERRWLESPLLSNAGRGTLGFLSGAGLAVLAFLPSAPSVLSTFSVGLAGLVWEIWLLIRERKERSPFLINPGPCTQRVASWRGFQPNAVVHGGPA